MVLTPRRRIFRSAAPPRPRRTGARRWVAGVAGAAIVALLAWGGAGLWHRAARAPAPPTEAPRSTTASRAAGQIHANATDVAVLDGETLRLGADIVRLAGVVAPSRLETCRDASGAAADCGAAATAALAALVRGKDVTCEIVGTDPAGRPTAACAAGGAALNPALLAPAGRP